jgi:hypothetical protein
MAADVIELARRHDEAFNSQNPEGRAAIEASVVEVVYPGGLGLRGHEQVLQPVRAFWDAIPDGKINVDTQLASGDVVFAEGTLTGTHTTPGPSGHRKAKSPPAASPSRFATRRSSASGRGSSSRSISTSTGSSSSTNSAQ